MESVFLAYSYAPEEAGKVKPLADLVSGILESQDILVRTGEYLEGQKLTDGVKSKIQESDALIALMTPRDPTANGQFRASQWVIDELQYARDAAKKPAIAVAYPNVQVTGLNSDAERIDYDAAQPADAFLKICETIGAWRRRIGRRVSVRMLPDEFTKKLLQARVQPEAIKARYQLISGTTFERLAEWRDATVGFPPGGAFASLCGVQDGANIELEVTCGPEKWRSNPTPQWLHVEMEKVG